MTPPRAALLAFLATAAAACALDHPSAPADATPELGFPDVGVVDVADGSNPADLPEAAADADVPADLACTGGEARCADTCTDLTRDPAHCGSCATACAPAHATPGCSAGHCAVSACAAGFGDCNADPADGCEVSTASDATNCGGCGRVCALPNADATCAAGACAVAGCRANAGDCDGTPANGCETDVRTSAANCGACAHACAFANAAAACAAGACVMGACAAGFADCDRGAGNGCEVNTATDAASCGACGHACPVVGSGTAVCVSGACDVVCNPGYARVPTGCALISAPRAIAPLSTATVTTRRPTLRWNLPVGIDGAHVALSPDRTFATAVTALDAASDHAAPATDLAPGVWFWRLTGRVGAARGVVPSPTWEFVVPAHGATPVDSSAGTMPDVNGDGAADVLVAARALGSVFIYHGAAGAAPLGAPAATLTMPAVAGFGWSVASAGDVNGDGYADVIVGANYFDATMGPTPNPAFVFYGGSAGVAANPVTTLAVPTGAQGFGYATASAGDVNRDGYADVIVGAAASNTAYVYFGGPLGLATTPTAVPGPPGSNFGRAVAGAGDVNGDGFGDVIVGANNSFQAFVYHGGPTGITSPATTLSFGRGYYGTSVAGAGDVNGDGFSDVVVGAYNTANAVVYYGGAAGVGAATATTVAGPVSFGFTVASAGDVNGDGFADLVVGAPTNATAHLYLGSAAGLVGTAAATFTDPAAVHPGSTFGVSVAGAGDVNRDGFADLLLGHSSADRAYVVRGAPAAAALHLTDTLTGPAGSVTTFGLWVASAADSPRRPAAAAAHVGGGGSRTAGDAPDGPSPGRAARPAARPRG